MTFERFGSGGPYEERIGYSRVVRAGNLYTTAGCTSTVDGSLVHEGDPYRQTLTAFTIGLDALEAAGCPRANVVQTRMYITDPSFSDDVGRAHHDLFAEIRPTAAMIVVAGFIDPRMLVEVELVGWVDPQP
jgi:enamine deaminase RidA (YjgF/YER057c/UK114 family)